MAPKTVGAEAVATLEVIRGLVQGWLDQQGHNKCHYYPELFLAMATELGLVPGEGAALPPREEFARGCAAFQEGLYGPLLRREQIAALPYLVDLPPDIRDMLR